MPFFLQDSIFAVFDDDQTGRVSVTNIKAVFLEAGVPGLTDATDDDYKVAWIDDYDKDGDGELNDEEFRMALTGPLGDAVFLFLDTDQTGTVTFKNLKDAQSESPEQFMPDASDEDIQRFIGEYDKDGDGGLDTEEFAAACAGGE